MLKFDLKLGDGTFLNQVILSTTKNDLSIGQFKTEEEFYNYLDSDEHKIIYFCGMYVQGGISTPQIILDHKIYNDEKKTIVLQCLCGKQYNFIPHECDKCGNIFVD
jgi:hypothetical protein